MAETATQEVVKEATEESLPQSEPTLQRPLTLSPYTDFPVAIRFGSKKKNPYYVPRHLLPPEWNKTGLEKQLVLSDLGEHTGHTLVHFLYTKEYKPLYTEDAFSTPKAQFEFKQALQVYTGTVTYNGLLDLRKLAKNELEKHGAELDIFQLLSAVKDDFAKLESESWVHEFLLKKAKSVFTEDHTVFEGAPFLECLDNMALSKFMMKCVMDLYKEKMSKMLKTQAELAEKVVIRDLLIDNLNAPGPRPAWPVTVRRQVIMPNGDVTWVKERVSEDALKQETVDSEDFCTISCPPSEHASDSVVSSEELTDHDEESMGRPAEAPEYSDELVGSAGETPTRLDLAPLKGPIHINWQSGPGTSVPMSPAEPTLAMPGSGLGSPVSKDLEQCSRRAKHLEGNKWKTCAKCKAFLQQKAAQLGGVGLA